MSTSINKSDLFSYIDNFSKHNHIESRFVFKAENYESAEITFVIPTYKRVDTLPDTLNSILTQEGSFNYTVIVIDNNPLRGDDTEKPDTA